MRTEKKNTNHKRQTPKLECFRSAITNGSALLVGVDERTAWCRRLRDLIQAHTADLGGDDNLTEAERQLVRRASVLCVQLEFMEVSWAKHGGQAGPKSLHNYQRCTNTLRRTLEALGLKRRPRDITPSLDSYVRRRRSRDVIDAEASA
jgi:hypothetical protein